MSASLRMFGSLWNAIAAHEHRRQDGSRLVVGIHCFLRLYPPKVKNKILKMGIRMRMMIIITRISSMIMAVTVAL